MLSAWLFPFLLCCLLLFFPCSLRRYGQSFMGTVHLWVMKKQRDTDLLEKGCDIGICLSILSFLFPLTLSCSLAFLVLFPWSASVTFILSYPRAEHLKAEHLNLLEYSFLTCQTALPRYQKICKFLLLSPYQWQCVCQRTLWKIHLSRPGKSISPLPKFALRNRTSAC